MKHKNIAIFIPHNGCPNQCSFCNQHTISGSSKTPTVDEIDDILLKAFEQISDKSTTEIAFFGGSFTAINRKYMLELLQVANKYIGKNKFIGIRISTRPDAIDEEILAILKKYNVTSIELGAQSMNDEVLSLNKRGHTSKDVVDASNLIKQFGFTLGLQMMVGLYGDTIEICRNTVKHIINISPDTVRIYPTVVLKNTLLAEKFKSGEYQCMPLEQAVSLCAEFLYEFEKNNITVIKLGLHASLDVEKNTVTGIYHPAFRELCESKLYLNNAKRQLENIIGKNIVIYVNPKCVSKMVGQKRVNIKILEKLGYAIKIIQDVSLGKYQLRVEKDG